MHATALVLYADFFIWEIFLSLLNFFLKGGGGQRGVWFGGPVGLRSWDF